MNTPLLIVGWSVRAAVQSARRGGFDPLAIDAFLDTDLAAAVVYSGTFRNWREIAPIAEALPPCEWMFCGGVENHPDVVAELSRRHRLLGASPTTLKRVRDPFELERVLARHGFAMPAMRRNLTASDRTTGGRWLVKKRASAGGMGVRRYRSGDQLLDGAYLQEFVDGDVWGATYLAAAGGRHLLGVCEQLRDDAEIHSPFRYCGSIGPLRVPDETLRKLQRLGNAIAAEFELRGLFGIDVIATPDGSLRPIEVNPRYTASMELLERALGRSLVELHVRACREEQAVTIPALDTNTLFAKQIVYCDHRAGATVTHDAVRRLDEWSHDGDPPEVADIPKAETHFAFGDPMATVFASAADRQAVEAALAAKSARLRSLLR